MNEDFYVDYEEAEYWFFICNLGRFIQMYGLSQILNDVSSVNTDVLKRD